MNLVRRYPGVKPFETDEQQLFFGRERDIQDLHDLVLLEKLVVLFGKSGYGKSSLINAGLIPLLTDKDLQEEDQMIPLTVRMRSYTEQEDSPVEKVRKEAFDQLKEADQAGEFQALWKEKGQTESLWSLFRARSGGKEEPQILLIFDQFEEFFTYPAAQQARFRKELAELLYTEIPQSLRDNWRGLDRDLRRFLSQPMRVKVLFAIRQDKLSLLNGLRAQLPAILQKRYELQGLTLAQAREAIVEPARLTEGTYESTAFAYEETALQTLFNELSQGQKTDPYAAGQAIRIESFLLQICCEYIESHVIREHDLLIEPHDLPDFANIYEAYYNGKIGELSEAQQAAARKLMEEGLLYYDAQSGDARRLSVDKDQLLLEFRREGVNDALLDILKNKFLIREERNSVGDFSYEISHDTLLPPILKAREIRQQEEEKRAIRRRNWRYAGIIGIVGAVAAGAIILAVWALGQRDLAQQAEEDARTAQQEAQAALDSLEAINLARFEENLAQGQNLLEAGAYEGALATFQIAFAYDSTSEVARAGMEEAKEKSGAEANFRTLMRQGGEQLRRAETQGNLTAMLGARSSFRQALATGYRNSVAQPQLDRVNNLLDETFSDLISRGDRAVQAGYLDSAKTHYGNALRIREDAEVRRKLNGL
ncbi:MAG: hypothetical protein AAF399_12915 [Bacteroidota bacterium]